MKDAPVEGRVYALTGGTGDKAISNGNTWAESEVLPKEKVMARIGEYAQLVTSLCAEYWKAHGFTHASAPEASVEYGSRYARVLTTGNGVHTFVDLTNGDILKSASWKAPAKNGVRGNIFADDMGASVITNHGAKYLR